MNEDVRLEPGVPDLFDTPEGKEALAGMFAPEFDNPFIERPRTNENSSQPAEHPEVAALRFQFSRELAQNI